MLIVRGYEKAKMMKISITILFSLVLLSCNQNSITLIKKYEKLHNSHDINEIMLLHHDDIKFELIGVWTKSGKEEIRELEEWDRTLNSNLKFETFVVRGDSVLCKVIEKNDWFKSVGIEQLVHDPTIFIVSKGHVKKIVAYPSEGISKEIGAKLGSIYSWSNMTRDSTINELIVNGEFIYSAETAKKWLYLLEKWNKYKAENNVDYKKR